MPIKPNYDNAKKKWQKNYAKWLIELIKKIFQKIVFLKKFQKSLLKQFWINDFNLFIYFFKRVNLFSTSGLIQFHLCPI